MPTYEEAIAAATAPDPERALELIERERVTNVVGVPTQSRDMLEHPRFAEFDTSSLTNVGGGCAPAPPELVKRVEAGFRRLAPFKVPSHWVVLGQPLPRNAAGRFLKRELREVVDGR